MLENNNHISDVGCFCFLGTFVKLRSDEFILKVDCPFKECVHPCGDDGVKDSNCKYWLNTRLSTQTWVYLCTECKWTNESPPSPPPPDCGRVRIQQETLYWLLQILQNCCSTTTGLLLYCIVQTAPYAVVLHYCYTVYSSTTILLPFSSTLIIVLFIYTLLVWDDDGRVQKTVQSERRWTSADLSSPQVLSCKVSDCSDRAQSQ